MALPLSSTVPLPLAAGFFNASIYALTYFGKPGLYNLTGHFFISNYQ